MTRKLFSMTLCLPLALALGCSSDDDAGDGVDAAVGADAQAAADAGEDVDADVDPDADVDLDADVDPDDLTLEVRFADAPGETWRAGAFRVHIVSDDGEDFPEVQEEIASAPVDDEIVELTLPEPDASQFGPFFVGEAASYLLAIYDDRDADGIRGENDPVEATREVVVFYLAEETDTGDGTTLPGRTWLAIELQIDGEPAPISLDDPIELAALPLVDTVTLGGSIDGDLLSDVTGLSSIIVGTGGVVEVFVNPPVDRDLAASPWEATIDEPLDDARRVAPADEFPFPVFAERVVAYESDDGELSSLAELRAFACHEGAVSLLFFVPEVLDPAEALMAHLVGYARGWLPVVAGNGAPAPLPPGSLDELTLEPDFDCS